MPRSSNHVQTSSSAASRDRTFETETERPVEHGIRRHVAQRRHSDPAHLGDLDPVACSQLRRSRAEDIADGGELDRLGDGDAVRAAHAESLRPSRDGPP